MNDPPKKVYRSTHALGQRASFRGEYGIPTGKIMEVANNHLCGGKHIASTIGDVRILAVEEKPLAFHARFDSKGKKYRYVIANGEEINIFRRNHCYHVLRPLDLKAMQKGASYIVGTHDFAAFQLNDPPKMVYRSTLKFL